MHIENLKLKGFVTVQLHGPDGAIKEERSFENRVVDVGLKYIAEEYGTRSTYAFSIRTVDDRLIGILSVDFTNRKKTFSEEDLVNLRLDATKIGGILGNKK